MHLSFERLESRLLLAAAIGRQGNTLVIVGDGGSDDVTIVGTGNEGEIEVSLNGGEAVLVEGITGIKASFGAGADTLNLYAVDLTGNVLVDMGAGDDEFHVEGGGTNIGGHLKVQAGTGDDDVTIDANADGDDHDPGLITIGKNVVIDLFEDNEDGDSLAIFGDTAGEVVEIGGGLSVFGRAGVQRVDIDSVEVGGNFKLDVGAGDDEVRLATLMNNADLSVTIDGNAVVKLGDGDDACDVLDGNAGTFRVGKNLTVDLGHDDGDPLNGGDVFTALADTAVTDVITVEGHFGIKGKDGVQDVNLDGVAVGGNLQVGLGAGNDRLDVGQAGGAVAVVVDGNFNVNFGAGDDDLLIERTTVGKHAKINGGAGDLDEANESTLGTFVAAKQTFPGVELGNLV